MLEQLQADIIGFQEVFSIEQLQTLVGEHQLDHFACVDTPNLEHDYIFSDPVVALASRYPILSAEAVQPSAQLLEQLGLNSFGFSRQILRAIVDVPHLGRMRVYVLHLKSGRSMLKDELKLVETQSHDWFIAQQLGRSLSQVQRQHEALVLLADFAKQQATCELPTAIVGDFNDHELSPVLETFAKGKRPPFIGVEHKHLSHQIHSYAEQISLHSMFDISELPSHPRPTHYWGPHGQRIDHILLSQEFVHTSDHALAGVSNALVFDRHLLNNQFERDRQCSDHAALCAQIQVRNLE